MTIHIHDYNPPIGWSQRGKLVLADSPTTALIHSNFGPFASRDDAIDYICHLYGDVGFHERRLGEFHPGPIEILDKVLTAKCCRFIVADTVVHSHDRADFESMISDWIANTCTSDGVEFDAPTLVLIKDAAWAQRDVLKTGDHTPGVSFSDDDTLKAICAITPDAGLRPALRGKKPWTSRAAGQTMYDLVDLAGSAGFIVLMHGSHVHFAKGAL